MDFYSLDYLHLPISATLCFVTDILLCYLGGVCEYVLLVVGSGSVPFIGLCYIGKFLDIC